MKTKIAGFALIAVGLAVLGMLLFRGGALFPHVIGPIVLAGAGTGILLRNRTKADEGNRRRVLLLVAVLAAVVGIGGAIALYGQSAVRGLIEMHGFDR